MHGYLCSFVAVYSQKFPNSTLEEVTCVAEEMVKLGERCCAEGATQDCYDKGVRTDDRYHTR